MKIMVTGAEGFIGQNLCVALRERGGFEVIPVSRACSADVLADSVGAADVVVHLAGVNRPQDPDDFASGNGDFTASLCALLAATGRRIPVAFSSSAQALLDNPYGNSKRVAENHLLSYAKISGAPVGLFRFVNVFGKWSRANYNSVVATFCYSIARGMPIRVDDPDAELRLTYIDDVVASLISFVESPGQGPRFIQTDPVHVTTVGALSRQIRSFRDGRSAMLTERVGDGFLRGLYATYVSFLPPTEFSYVLEKHGDSRGVFVEMLKTPDCGQVSFFSAHPGVTRGGHYHHTKTEKFLVIRGSARYRFRHLLTDESVEIESNGDSPMIVESIPGWVHDITNTGVDELLVMLWANEVFDPSKPDTVTDRL